MTVISTEIIQGFLEGIRPVERLSPSDWADTYRFLDSAASAEPGRWRTSRTPYSKEILDRFSPYDPAKEIIVMKGAQLGFTELGFCVIGYFIHLDPCPILYVMPTKETMERNSKMRIGPMITTTPVLAERIGPARAKDSGNSLYQKIFPGGTLILSGANSPASLRSMPIKVLILDETDAYPLDLGGEGSPIKLANARTRTFAKKKIFYLSTPKIHLSSVIERKFLETSQRYYNVPCPFCKKMQRLDWVNLKYETNASKEKVVKSSVHYQCCECGGKIKEHHKTKMLPAGKWIESAPEKSNPEKVGYHINSLYSPLGWYSWAEAVQDWLDAQSDIEELKVFVNTVLGETWNEKGEVPDWENLYNRRLAYDTNKPAKEVCFITVGVDVQKDRLELEIVGWCKGKTSYSIDYRVLPGATAELPVWNELAKVVTEQWERADGVLLPMHKMAIDTGYNTAQVYGFCRRFSLSQVVPVKGQEKQSVIISQPRGVDHKKRNTRKHSLTGLVLYNVGVSILKQEIYGFLKLKIEEDVIPSGYCFFPTVYDQHYFKMLTAESLTKELVKGFTRYVWVKIRERNEALDCRVYARAAAAISGMDRWKPEHWNALAATYGHRQDMAPVKKRKKSDFW